VSIFGVPFDELALEHVRTFLAGAEDESILWEAKGGGERPHPRVVRKAVCGFANSRGGYLILGADRPDDTWSLSGIDFGSNVEEPRTWLDQVIRDGMSPVPPMMCACTPSTKGGRLR
jgi:Schlafen, AlbA_2